MAADAAGFTLHDGALVGGVSVAIGRYDGVEDPEGLADRVLEATGVPVAVIDPHIVVGELHVLVAANKAAHLRTLGKLKTADVHTEVLYQLSPATSIAATVETFGPAGLPSPASVVVCVLDATEDRLAQVAPHVGGKPVPAGEPYAARVDAAAVAKLFKLDAAAADAATLLDAVVTKLAIKQPA